MEPVLVVDDEPQIRALVRHWVETFGYQAHEAENATAALEVMERSNVSVAVCDVRMPGHDGLWLTNQIKDQHPDTAVIIASGGTDPMVAERAMASGALDFLVKPFGGERLASALRRAADWHRDAVSTRGWVDRLRAEMEARRSRLEALVDGAAPAGMVDDPRLQEFELDAKAVWGSSSLARLIEWRSTADPLGHQSAQRIARFAAAVGARLGMSSDQVATLRAAGLVHDFGRLMIPPSLLDKPADFTPEERALVRQHPVLAFHLLRRQAELAGPAEVVLSAYEGFGGVGYPQGLTGTEIPLGSRILAVAIAYQAMTSPRPHRAAMPSSEAVLELCRCRDTQFDPDVVEAFVRILTSH